MPENRLDAQINQTRVLTEEHDIILQRRAVAGLNNERFTQGWFDNSADAANQPAHDASADIDAKLRLASVNPVGLSLSGGGVRSAAFALGVIQAFHRFGLMRYVDYLSAVSGGTYAAGMFVKSLQKNRRYAKDHCDLAPDRTGKSSGFVQQVSSRGNYLFRSDLFLARFIPGFVLNLAPQLCLLIAIGSGTAFLWRSLDFHPVRDHLSAFGINDLSAAFLPAVLLGIAWILIYIAGIIAASRPLKRISTWLLAATLASFLIGAAVVVGNGDVTFTRENSAPVGEERRIRWLNDLWTPLVSIVVLGCIPLFMPGKLLRSGTRPRGWFDSWVFYYVSLALFIGVPLVFIGYFAKENISGYNNARRDAILPADIKDLPAFKRLVETKADASATYKFGDIPLQIRFNFSSPILDAALHNVEEVLNEQHESGVALRRTNQYPPPYRDHALAGDYNWYQVKYLRWLTPAPGQFAAWLTGSGGKNYEDYITSRKKIRNIETVLAKELTRIAKASLLFELSPVADAANTADPTAPVINVSDVPQELRKQLLTIASLDRPHAPLENWWPKPAYAALNRNLLEAAFPQIIRDRTELRRANLIEMDQQHRLIWFGCSLLGAIVIGWCIDPNQTGLHGYYRDRLAGTYLNRSRSEAGEVFPEINTDTLSEVTPHEQGAAYPLFQTSALIRQAWQHADQLEMPFRPFVLSPAYCGNSHLQYIATKSLGEREPTLADTIAISGGAVDPAFFVHHIIAFLTNAMNWRMGQLFPNPQLTHWRRPSMLHELWEHLKQTLTPSESRVPMNVLLTDGGHSENLGIEPLLTRRCRLIIVSDAGHDPEHVLDDLAKVVRRLESTQGIRLVDVIPRQSDASPADGQPLRIPGNMAEPVSLKNCSEATRAHRESVDRLFKRLAKEADTRHFFVAKILYPECGAADSNGRSEHPQFEGRLVYIKPCLTGDEGLQLCNYAFRHAEFPHESTLDQAFDEAQFEAYRRLGFHSGVDLCRDLPDPDGIDRKDAETSLWSTSTPWSLSEVCERLLGADGFTSQARHARKRILATIQCSQQDGDEKLLVNELEAYQSDLSFAADILVELPFANDSCPLPSGAGLIEYFDQRAVMPLARFINKPSRGAKQAEAIGRAIDWLKQLVQGDEQVTLQEAITSLTEFAQRTRSPRYGSATVELLKLAAETSAASMGDVMSVLKQVIKHRKAGRVRSAAREALAALEERHSGQANAAPRAASDAPVGTAG